MKIIRYHPDAKLPTKAHSGDLGYDLYALESCQVFPGCMVKMRTGIGIEFPYPYGGIILDRSSMASKRIAITGGVIDHEYTGEISVLINNLIVTEDLSDTYVITAGDKIAQLVPIVATNWPIEWHDGEVAATTRGDKGFGSSGS